MAGHDVHVDGALSSLCHLHELADEALCDLAQLGAMGSTGCRILVVTPLGDKVGPVGEVLPDCQGPLVLRALQAMGLVCIEL